MRAGLVVIVLAACGCNDPTYLGENAPIETRPAQGMMGGGFAPATGLYVLPVRQPSETERRALQELQQRLMLPDAVPWAQARDFDVEIEWSVKNLDSLKATVIVALDGGNEFGDYVPGAYINPNANAENQAPPPDLLTTEPLVIEAGAMASGIFREDDLQESAVDLEAITRFPSGGDALATPFMVIEHRSSVSGIGLESVPANDITPAHVRYAFTVSADAHVIMDYAVRVRDHDGKLAKPGDKDLYVNRAATVAPPIAPPTP
ncbi:MAG: hypothetical protein LC659_10375 [Myxococcales bacterium]|nr:hypothetical protein [Myxococcales bacterium]